MPPAAFENEVVQRLSLTRASVSLAQFLGKLCRECCRSFLRIRLRPFIDRRDFLQNDRNHIRPLRSVGPGSKQELMVADHAVAIRQNASSGLPLSRSKKWLPDRPCIDAATLEGCSCIRWSEDGAKPKLAAIIADVSEEQAAPSEPRLSASDQQERAQLNNRELEALRLVVQGLANKEIASHMGISESAVKNTMQQLFAKTEVRTRGQLVRVALERYRDLL